MDLPHPLVESLEGKYDTASAVRWPSACHPREDLHFRLHMKRNDGLRWTAGHWGAGVRMPDPQ